MQCFEKKNPQKTIKKKVTKPLSYIRAEQDTQICLTTDTEHASHPAKSNEYRLVAWNTVKGSELLTYWSKKVNERERNRAIFGHISSFSNGLFHCWVRRGADVLRHVYLSFGLDRLHRFYQAAAGQHHIPCSHVFSLQLPQALLTVPDPIAKIDTETWKNKITVKCFKTKD